MWQRESGRRREHQLKAQVAERTQALSYAEEQVRSLFETSQVGIGLATIEGEVLAANDSLRRMLQYSEVEMLQSNVTEFYSAYENRNKLLERLSVSRSVNDFGVKLKRKDGTTFLANLNVSKVFREEQEVILALIEDVTNIIKIEEALRESEQKFRALFQGVPVPAYTWRRVGEDFVLVDFNAEASAITGGNIGDFVGMTLSTMYTDRPDIVKDISRSFAEKVTFQREMAYSFKSTGEDKTLVVKYAFVPPDLVLIQTEDITYRKRAEDALQKSEEAYRNLVEKVSDVIYSVDSDGIIIYLNPAIESLIGLPPEQVVGQPFAQFVHPEDLGRLQDNFRNLVSGVTPGPVEYRVLTASGETRWIHVTSQPIMDGERFTGLQGVLTDITERKMTEGQLEEAAANVERDRLARRLHDAITQTLFSASVMAEATPRIWPKDPAQAQRNMEQLAVMLRGAMAEMRTMVIELRPAAVSGKSLGQLLDTLVEANQPRISEPISIVVEGDRMLPLDVTIAFYRIAQEAFHNVAQHAEATEVDIKIVFDQEGVMLSVRDNGRGFDQNMIPAGHFGLSIMGSRAEEVGGNLVIESEPGAGTEVIASWSERGSEEES